MTPIRNFFKFRKMEKILRELADGTNKNQQKRVDRRSTVGR
jgi:hypothetical protein